MSVSNCQCPSMAWRFGPFWGCLPCWALELLDWGDGGTLCVCASAARHVSWEWGAESCLSYHRTLALNRWALFKDNREMLTVGGLIEGRGNWSWYTSPERPSIAETWTSFITRLEVLFDSWCLPSIFQPDSKNLIQEFWNNHEGLRSTG